MRMRNHMSMRSHWFQCLSGIWPSSQEGFREGNDKVCEACGDGDYAFFGVVVALVFGALG